MSACREVAEALKELAQEMRAQQEFLMQMVAINQELLSALIPDDAEAEEDDYLGGD